jgi:hypothetical protein
VTFLRYLALIALALWIGGLAALGLVAAPELFDVLEARHAAGGRELAGEIFGGIFTRFQYLVWGLGGVLLASLGTRAALGPRPRRFAVRMWTVSAMLAASVATTVVIAPRIDDIRREVTGPVALLSNDDARKVTFGQLHAVSNGLMLLTMLAGVGLIWVEMRDSH